MPEPNDYDEDDEDTGFDGGWDRARDHGHALAQWIGESDGYSHPTFAERDADGRFTRRSRTTALREDLD